MKQYFLQKAQSSYNSGSTQYMCPTGSGATSFDLQQNERSMVVATAGTFRNLGINLPTAPGSGKSVTFNLMVNGSASALTVTISDTATSGEDTTHDVSVSAGDYVSWQAVPSGTPTVSAPSFTMEFESSGAAHFITGGSNSGPGNSVNYTSPLAMFNTWAAGEENGTSPVPLDCIIRTFYIRLGTAPGAGKSRTFELLKNGSAIDSIVISESATTGSLTSLGYDLVPGDTLSIKHTPAGTPATSTVGFGLSYEADIDGESWFGGITSDNLSSSATEYHQINTNSSTGSWNSDETLKDVVLRGTGNTFKIRKLRVLLTGAPGASKSYTFNIRKSLAAGNNTITISGASDISGIDSTNTDTFVVGDSIDIQCVPAGTPTVRDAAWSTVMFTGTEPINISVNDVLTITESVSITNANLYRDNLVDTITITESVSIQNQTGSSSVNDVLTITDVATLDIPIEINVNDQLSISEDVVVENTQLGGINVSDDISITEVYDVVAETPIVDIDISVVDNVGINEDISIENTELGGINIIDNISITDVVTTQIPALGNISVVDNITISEQVGVLLISEINIVDTIFISENLEFEMNSSVNVFDTITITEDINTENANLGNISVVDNVTITEEITSQASDLEIDVTAQMVWGIVIRD